MKIMRLISGGGRAIVRFMTHLARDLVLALRRGRQRPALFLGACALLALAVGGNTAVFTAINAVILRPLALDNERELVAVHIKRDDVSRYPLSLPLFLELARRRAGSGAWRHFSSGAPTSPVSPMLSACRPCA